MNSKQHIKSALFLLLATAYTLLSSGCEEIKTPSNLMITNMVFTETYSNQHLNLPNGSYIPDNENFDIDNPETWTGNMAQYINYNYLYKVSYQIKNIGEMTAYDSEIDLYYSFDNDEEEAKTVVLGDITPGRSISKSDNYICTNKQMIKTSGEVFWFEKSLK